MHDTGAKLVLGHTITSAGVNEGLTVLRMLSEAIDMLPLNKVLVGTDGSPLAVPTVARAAWLAAHDDAEHAALYPLAGKVLGDAAMVEKFAAAHSAVKQQIDRMKHTEGAALVVAAGTAGARGRRRCRGGHRRPAARLRHLPFGPAPVPHRHPAGAARRSRRWPGAGPSA